MREKRRVPARSKQGGPGDDSGSRGRLRSGHHIRQMRMGSVSFSHSHSIPIILSFIAHFVHIKPNYPIIKWSFVTAFKLTNWFLWLWLKLTEVKIQAVLHRRLLFTLLSDIQEWKPVVTYNTLPLVRPIARVWRAPLNKVVLKRNSKECHLSFLDLFRIPWDTIVKKYYSWDLRE
jgi:hypothetical protein